MVSAPAPAATACRMLLLRLLLLHSIDLLYIERESANRYRDIIGTTGHRHLDAETADSVGRPTQ